MFNDYTVLQYADLPLCAFLPLDGWLVKGVPTFLLDIYKHV